jgi:hypothetical protein
VDSLKLWLLHPPSPSVERDPIGEEAGQIPQQKSKREEVTERWRKCCNEELHNLYASPNVIRIIKSRRMR